VDENTSYNLKIVRDKAEALLDQRFLIYLIWA